MFPRIFRYTEYSVLTINLSDFEIIEIEMKTFIIIFITIELMV